MDGDAPAVEPADHTHTIDRLHGQVCAIKTQACVQQWQDKECYWISTQAPVVRSRGTEGGCRKVEGGGDVAAVRRAVMQSNWTAQTSTEGLIFGTWVFAFSFRSCCSLIAMF